VNEAVEQVAYADRIVLNKTDLVSPPRRQQLRAAALPAPPP
jgi:G3E family GTPase